MLEMKEGSESTKIFIDKARTLWYNDGENGEIMEDLAKYFVAPREPDGRKVEDRKTFEVNELWELHHEIVRRLTLGQKSVEIARSLNVSKAMVSYTKNSKVVKKQLDLMRGARDAETLDIAIRIRENAPEALALLEDIIEDHGDTHGIALAARTAESMLDRGGYAAPKKLEGVVAHFTGEEITKLKQEALDASQDSGLVIDGEVEEVEDA